MSKVCATHPNRLLTPKGNCSDCIRESKLTPPRPTEGKQWKVVYSKYGQDPDFIVDVKDQDQIIIERIRQQDAELIVTAVNLHERLVAALEEIEKWIAGVAQDYVPNDVFHRTEGYKKMEFIRALLSEANRGSK